MKSKKIGIFSLVILTVMMALSMTVLIWAAETVPRLSTPTGLTWDGEKAVWDEVEGCRRYQIQLYRDARLVDTISTRKTEYSFRSKMTKSGDYRFRIKAMTPDSTHRDSSWSEISDGYSIDEEFAKAIEEARKVDSAVNRKTEDGGEYVGPGEIRYEKAEWLRDENGYWYRNQDGSYTKNGWQYIDGKWYFFDENGYMKTGWIPWKDLWYYCGADGAMLVSTTTPDGYTVNGDGVWVQ